MQHDRAVFPVPLIYPLHACIATSYAPFFPLKLLRHQPQISNREDDDVDSELVLDADARPPDSLRRGRRGKPQDWLGPTPYVTAFPALGGNKLHLFYMNQGPPNWADAGGDPKSWDAVSPCPPWRPLANRPALATAKLLSWSDLPWWWVVELSSCENITS